MLETIKITNLALINKSVVNFTEGFNVLTGETGAGKSLIVDALLFLTGIRADKTLIKSGEDYAKVEGVFSVDVNNERINNILRDVDIDNEGTIIISRHFALNGKNECRVNGEQVTLNTIRKLSSELIDIFGQNDSMVLLDPSNHLSLIDSMIEDKLSSKKLELSDSLFKLKCINESISELGGLDSDREKNIDFIQFQIDEISNANLKDGEEEEIKSQILIMENSEKIFNSLNQSIDILDGEYSIGNAFKSAINTLSQSIQYDEDLSKEKDRLYSIKYELEDIVGNLLSKKNQLTYSEFELDKLNDRLTEIKDLERKYGNTILDILNTKNQLEDRLDMLVNADKKLEILRSEKNQILKEIFRICNDLHDIRANEIVKFRNGMIIELQNLGMKNANFDVVFTNDYSLENIESKVTLNGADTVEFMFSANLGVELRSLNKIISGGEMSRFMLAFKTLQNSNQSKTCIFDEIDAGIGGEIGVIIGQKICQISTNLQVICITHLAQIASFGDSNYKIEKFDEDNKTLTQVKLLNFDEKVIEIARMLGNASNTISINHAKEIIEESLSYKKFISK